ncbi:ubiquitin conjugating enzyme [Histoplasma capsulatum var. duboisii H88]|uniref:Ubiquitin-conjugating enzyme E2 Z n=1 Tax=Ajellomyces capsulatus (strain H88) TaxID=544711 RepID=F0U747_AJEC8|nr:ubiquitin conjugating enzyme [Histoplasma capsulatum var. duboisii H88]
MSNQAILRIGREISQIQHGTDLSLAVACKEADIRSIKALIVGPPETPYEFGFFEFSIKFPEDYPGTPPTVHATTTNGGRCRYNPNIYASGKVCLSILGTWRGESGEQWSSAQGLESVLISIQSLMSSNPYENEPGFENASSDRDKQNMAHYVAKIRHETLRISVIQRLEEFLGIQSDGTIFPPCPPGFVDDEEEEEDRLTGEDDRPAFDPFEDLLKRRFLWYFESYILAIDAAEPEVTPSQIFKKMPFENPSNSMDGRFYYPELRKRLIFIKETIVNETEGWAAEGMKAKVKETRIAVNLQRQYEQIVEDLKNRKNFMIDLGLENGNPFLWNVTFFGKPMTQLDGGIFQIRICLSPKFPDEQPRVIVKTPLFHNRISKDGVLCYFPKKLEEMKSHVEAIMEALEDESPPYDPRTTVNPEASKLFWGSADDKKKYNRLLRRSVQRSVE